MNTFSGKAMTFFMMFVMIVNQFEPVAALQSKAQAPASSPVTAGVVAPIGQRGMNRKTAKAPVYNQPAAPEPVQPSIKLSAKPKFVTGSGSVTIDWALNGDLPKDTTLTLQVTFPEGYIPDVTRQDVYDASTHILNLSVPYPTPYGDTAGTM
jgi:hypothetical protein